MKALFLHDTKINYCNGNYYSNGLSKEIWKRYLIHFDELTVCCRKQVNTITKDAISSTENVNFNCVKNINVGKILLSRQDRNLIKNLVKNNDAIIIRLGSVIGLIGVHFALKYKKPFLVELVGCPRDSYYNHSLAGKFVAPIMSFLVKQAIRKASHVIYVTNKFLQKRYPTKGKSIGCSDVMLSETDQSILEKRIERIKNHENEIKVIGTAAVIDVPYKAQSDIIKVMGILKKQGELNYKYQCVGSGDKTLLLNEAKRNNVTDEVELIGTLTHSEIFKWLDTIDIYVQPSRTEGLPRALIEAMSRGLPCCGSNVGGIPELIEKDFLFNSSGKNPQQIMDILNKFDVKVMASQAKRNFEMSKEYFTNITENRRNKFLSNFAEKIMNNK